MTWQSKQIHLMGTVIDVMIQHEKAEEILEQVDNQLRENEIRFSANNDKSELMAVNLHAGKEWVNVHPSLFKLIELGKHHSVASNSFLNISIGPLTKAWRIGFPDGRKPQESEIIKLLKQIDPSRIRLDSKNSSVYLEEGMSIDLGALAKGYIADIIVEDLKKQGVQSALINLGGNVVTFGSAPNKQRKEWRIGIKNPRETEEVYSEILKVTNQSVVTSGIYERVLEANNQKYHHIFDSKTGYPVETPILSLTIISEKSVDGEIWTTRLFGNKPEEIINIVNGLTGIEALVITEEKNYYSKGMTKYL